MDNGDSLLEDLDQTDLFGNHGEGNGSLFNWADEFLGDDHDPSNIALDTGNLATNVNPTYHLTSQNYAVTSTNPIQLQSLSSRQLPTQANAGITTVLQQAFVPSAQTDGSSSQMLNQGGDHVILKTASGQQIQVTRQMHLQLQQQLLQQQQQQQQQQQLQSSGFSSQQPVALLGRSVTPNSGVTLSFTNTPSISQTLSQLKSTSPAPNMSILQLPGSMQQHQTQMQGPQQIQMQGPQQIQMQGPQQIQLSNGTILQLPFAGAQSGLVQGQTVLGNQQGTMVNANPNIVNVNMGPQQMIQTQQRSNFQLANFQSAPQPPFNIQGTLIRTAEGKNILIPSQNMAQPINIQGLSLGTSLQIQQPAQNTISSVLLSQQQSSGLTMDNRANQGLQQIVLNHQGGQYLLQRGAVTVSQPQNIVVRAATAQPNILQLQPTQQIQTLSAQSMTQPVQLINQSGQSAVTMVNIGGQNIPLSQLSAHLGNLQNQHQQHQVPKQQQQQQISHPPASASPLTFSQGQQNVPQQQGGGQQRLLLGNAPAVTSVNVSGDSQMQMILQQIQDSLQKSQAATNTAVSKKLQTFSAVHALPNMAVTSIKQEPGIVAQSNRVVTQTFVPSVSVKSEASIIDSLIKKEADVKPFMASCSVGASANISQLLQQNNVQYTPVTTTVSNATTPMSLYLVSNSAQNVGSTSSSISSALSTTNSSMTNVPHSSSDFVSADTATISIQRQQPSGVMSVQTIQLPVEFQQHFQRVQLQIKNVQAATNISAEQKHEQLQQLYMFQKKILLKGRVISSTKTEANQQQLNSAVSQSHPLSFDSQSLTSNRINSVPNQTSTTMQQALTAASIGPKMSTMSSSAAHTMSSVSASPQFSQAPSPSASHSTMGVNHLPPTPAVNVSMATQSQAVETPQATTEASAPQVAVPTQIKIADKVLTLSLTPAQREKVQSYLDRMTPEQQQQYLQSQQHVLQRIQRQQQLNAQVRAQVEAQKKLAGPGLNQAGSSDSQDTDVAVTLEPLSSSINIASQGIAMQPLAEVRKISGPVPVASVTQVKVEPTTALQRGTKRSFMDIPKETLFNQQIRQDQNHAVAPDTKRPFKSKGDACRRLLRFHVFQSYGPCGADFEKFDGNFGDISDDLLQKKDRMVEKFRHLLFQETIREQPSSELVMLQRMQNQELRKLIEEERRQVSLDPASFRPMPMRYLCKTADRQTSRIESEICESPPLEHIDDAASDNGVNLDSSYDDPVDVNEHSSKEIGDSEIKVRKLVIKTDGMRFSSTFKRNSLDQSLTSCSEMGEESESGGDMDSPEKTSHYLDKGLYDPHSSVDDNSDEDTNEYSGDNTCSFEEETKQAAILISSADEGESAQLEDVYSFGNSNSLSGQSAADINGESRHNYELTDQSFHRSNHYESLNSVDDQLTGFDPINDGYIPDQSPLSDDDTGDETLDQFDMYQPITECLTDSEENSCIPTAVADRRPSVGGNIHSAGSNPHLYRQESDPESDQEVKAQMESAIHSILSLSSGDAPPSVFMYSGSQQNHVLTNNHLRPLSSGHRNSAAHLSSIDNPMAEFEHDLDDAVNSILI